jgi:hypothetical protein
MGKNKQTNPVTGNSAQKKLAPAHAQIDESDHENGELKQ